MRIAAECPECLERLVRQTAKYATNDEGLQRRAIDEAMDTVRLVLSPDKVPTQVSGEAQRVIRAVTGNRDPYRQWKDREMDQAGRLFTSVRASYRDGIQSLLTLSLVGNAMDFFKDVSTVEKEMARPVQFGVDHIDKVTEFLDAARSALFMSDDRMEDVLCFVPGVNLCMKKALFLADNAGECFFDLPIVNEMAGLMRVSYVVKKSPVQNDLTEEDLLLSGLYPKMAAEVVSATDTPGLDLSLTSGEFRKEFASADLIVAKGMGHWETLSELSPNGKVFHLLVAKCAPVARSLGVPLGSYVAILR
ncbi:MAG: DUF89 family protein [Chloroflexi bacterium]|nr:DUF89 family protein [Chloroflexota bacterium]